MQIFISVVSVFIIRFLLSLLPSFNIDMGTWIGWAERLSSLGLSHFYSDSVWTQYTPGFLYYLWFIGKVGIAHSLAIKIPVLLADFGVGLLIWKLVKKVNKKIALVVFLLYTLNPVAIFDGSVWGQIDGILTLALFLSAYFLIEKKNFIWSVVFWSAAFLIKPQAIAILPAFILPIILKKFKWKDIFLGIFIGLAAIFMLSLPFFRGNPILGLPDLIIKMHNSYSFRSLPKLKATHPKKKPLPKEVPPLHL